MDWQLVMQDLFQDRDGQEPEGFTVVKNGGATAIEKDAGAGYLEVKVPVPNDAVLVHEPDWHPPRGGIWKVGLKFFVESMPPNNNIMVLNWINQNTPGPVTNTVWQQQTNVLCVITTSWGGRAHIGIVKSSGTTNYWWSGSGWGDVNDAVLVPYGMDTWLAEMYSEDGVTVHARLLDEVGETVFMDATEAVENLRGTEADWMVTGEPLTNYHLGTLRVHEYARYQSATVVTMPAQRRAFIRDTGRRGFLLDTARRGFIYDTERRTLGNG